MTISVLRDHNAFKTLITTHPKKHRCHISEDLTPHEHCCENLKFHIKEALYHSSPTYLKDFSSPDYLWRVIVTMKFSNINLKIRKLTQKYLCLFFYVQEPALTHVEIIHALITSVMACHMYIFCFSALQYSHHEITYSASTDTTKSGTCTCARVHARTHTHPYNRHPLSYNNIQ